MDIVFASERDRQLFNSQKMLTKNYGATAAKVIRRRLDDLSKVLTLAEMRDLPGRCHELVYRKWDLSIDLEQPDRLIFEPLETPVPLTAVGGLDWTRVRGVRIKGIEDTHE